MPSKDRTSRWFVRQRCLNIRGTGRSSDYPALVARWWPNETWIVADIVTDMVPGVFGGGDAA